MKTSWLAGWILLGAMVVPAEAQVTVEQRRLVDQLVGPQREEAHRELVAQGRGAISALVDGLDDQRPEVVRQVLVILGELGPDATSAVPVLLDRARSDGPFSANCLWSLADLAPFRPKNMDLDDRGLASLEMRWLGHGRIPELMWIQAMSRLRARCDFPTDLGLQDLVAAVQSFQPYRLELAV